mmetsp:Transcript_50675/g.94719  ORF Transcript_50675/g.94719 Transcript_50675/m.94719 type:complete len:1074 (+) Transcript_50675:75-3296(+)
MPNLHVHMAAPSLLQLGLFLAFVRQILSLQLAPVAEHKQLPSRIHRHLRPSRDRRQGEDRGQRHDPSRRPQIPGLGKDPPPDLEPLPDLPGGLGGLFGGMGGGGGLDLSKYKNSTGLVTLYTDPGNLEDLLVDITDLLKKGSGLIMVTALASEGSYNDNDGTVLPLHFPMEETHTTIFKLVATKDNKSIDVLQPQLSMRTSDSDSKTAWAKGVDSPWIGNLERMETSAGEDRIVVDGIQLIQKGFFVSPRLGKHIKTYRLTRVKAYPENFDVSLTFLIDDMQMSVTFSVIRPPEEPMTPRVYDDRLPYFTQDYTDLGVHTSEFKDGVIDPRKKIDPDISVIWKYNINRLPDKQIRIHVDPSVPEKWHKACKKGIEAWNDAFKLAGYAENTIRAVLPSDDDWPKDYDAGDVKFSTISWVVDSTEVFSAGIAKVDPRSGEILKSDIIMGAGWVRSWLNDLHEMALTSTQDRQLGLFQESLQQHEEQNARLRVPLHPNSARAGKGFSTPPSLLQAGSETGSGAGAGSGLADAASDSKRKTETEAEHAVLSLLGNVPLTLMAMDLPKESWLDVVEAGLKDVVMHETGHILGLRHNFKGSLGVSYECTQNMTCSAEQGLTASVMDYVPMNIPSAGVENVHLFSPVVGAYDKLAIQYGYMNLDSSLEDENGVPAIPDMLRDILEKANHYQNCLDGELEFGADPLCAAYDLTSDPLRYYEDQILLLQKLQSSMFDKSVGPGEPYWQYGDIVASMMSNLFSIQRRLTYWVGGMNVSYVHRPYSTAPGVAQTTSQRSVRTIREKDQKRAMKLLLDLSRPGGKGLLPSPDRLKDLPYFDEMDDSLAPYNLKADIRNIQDSIMKKLLETSTLRNIELSSDFGGLGVDTFLDDVVYQVLGSYEGKWITQSAPEDWDLQMFLVQGLVQKREDELAESLQPQLLIAMKSALRAVEGGLERLGDADAPAAWTRCNSPLSETCVCFGHARFWSGKDWASNVSSRGSVECNAETFGVKSDVPDPVCECLRGPSAEDPLRTHLLELKNKLKKHAKKNGVKLSQKSAATKQGLVMSFFLALAWALFTPAVRR